MDEGNVIEASYKFHYIRVHDNLLKDPNNNKSIVQLVLQNIKLHGINIFVCSTERRQDADRQTRENPDLFHRRGHHEAKHATERGENPYG